MSNIISNIQIFNPLPLSKVFAPSKIIANKMAYTFNLPLLSEFMQVNGGNKTGLNELLADMLYNESTNIFIKYLKLFF